MKHGQPGADIFYSGTVAAAREGAMRKLPAIAISADTKADRGAAAALGARLAMALLHIGAERALATPLLNVNIPPGDRWEVRATRVGTRLYDNAVVFRTDPRGQEYLWIGGASVRHEQAPGSDTEAYDEGCVSVTPLAMDLHDTATSAAAAAVAASVRGADDSHSTMAGKHAGAHPALAATRQTGARCIVARMSGTSPPSPHARATARAPARCAGFPEAGIVYKDITRCCRPARLPHHARPWRSASSRAHRRRGRHRIARVHLAARWGRALRSFVPVRSRASCQRHRPRGLRAGYG